MNATALAVRPSFVLDCSVAAHWVFSGEEAMPGSAFAVALLQRMPALVAVVPGLWHVELAAMLRKGAQQKRLKATPQEVVAQLSAFDLRTDAILPDALTLTELSRQCGASAYDSVYLDLCQRLRLPLATLDERLKPCAERAQVKLFQFD